MLFIVWLWSARLNDVISRVKMLPGSDWTSGVWLKCDRLQSEQGWGAEVTSRGFIKMMMMMIMIMMMIMTTNIQDSQSDRAVLSRPSLVLVTWLLDSSLDGVTKTIGSRLAAALAACAQLSSLGVH